MSDYRLTEAQPSISPSTSQNYLLQVTNRLTARQLFATMARNSNGRRMVTVLSEPTSSQELYQPQIATTSQSITNLVPSLAESSSPMASSHSDRLSRTANTEIFMNAAQLLTIHPYGGAMARRVNPGEGRRGEGGRIRNGRVMPDQSDGDLTRPSSSNSSIEESSSGASTFDAGNVSTPATIQNDPIYTALLNLQSNDVSLSPVPSTSDFITAPRPTRRRQEMITDPSETPIGVNVNWLPSMNSGHSAFDPPDVAHQQRTSVIQPQISNMQGPTAVSRSNTAENNFNTFQHLLQNRNPIRVEPSRSLDSFRSSRRRQDLAANVPEPTMGINEQWLLPSNAGHSAFEANEVVHQARTSATLPQVTNEQMAATINRNNTGENNLNVFQHLQNRNSMVRVETSRSSDSFRRILPPIHVESTPDLFEIYPTDHSSLRFNSYPSSRSELNQLPRGPATTRNVTRIVRFQELLASSNAFTSSRFGRRTEAQVSDTNDFPKSQERDSPAGKRLRQDAEHFRKHAPSCCSVAPKEEDIFQWSGLLEGSPSSPYENGYFFFELRFTTEYPQKLPEIVMLTRIWHPWVLPSGKVKFPGAEMDKIAEEGLSGLLKALLEMLQEVPPDTQSPSVTTTFMEKMVDDDSKLEDELTSRKRRREIAQVWTKRYAT